MNIYDLAILGGGINGVAIARDAAQRGLKVILFEKSDFASGASSKSSKLVHGGLRYLTSYSFHLVKESLTERALLLKNAPHLVKPLAFLYPVYKGQDYPLWQVKLGISFYNWLSKREFPQRNLAQSEIATLMPNLTMHDLKGGCCYFDAQMQDNRLVIENMLSAEAEGATLLNYTAVTSVKKGRETFHLETEKGSFEAKCVVNATGAWSNLTRTSLHLSENFSVHPTKGVHVVLPQINPTHALALTAPQDGRLFFLIPWMGYSLLGTTDTPFTGNPDKVEAEKEDVDYLLTALSHYFPTISLSPIASFAGLRPLAKTSKTNGTISREHSIHVTPDGVLTVLGGKYTTYRKIAEEVVDTAIRYLRVPPLPCRTASTPLYGAHNNLWETFSEKELEQRAHQFQISLVQLKRLIGQYGSATSQILDFIKQDSKEKEQICPHHPHLFAELSHAILNEKARTPSDWYERRTSIAYSEGNGKCCYQKVAKRFS